MMIRRGMMGLSGLLLSACTSLQLQSPDVLLAGLKMLPADGMSPRFEI